MILTHACVQGFVGWVDVLMFCFFKQKTANEMRIRDWSSDVCSSDLIGGDQKRVVIIAVPARTAVGGRQAVIAGVVDPVARAIEQRVQAEADAEPRISVTAIRVVIARHPVMRRKSVV